MQSRERGLGSGQRVCKSRLGTLRNNKLETEKGGLEGIRVSSIDELNLVQIDQTNDERKKKNTKKKHTNQTAGLVIIYNGKYTLGVFNITELEQLTL